MEGEVKLSSKERSSSTLAEVLPFVTRLSPLFLMLRLQNGDYRSGLLQVVSSGREENRGQAAEGDFNYCQNRCDIAKVSFFFSSSVLYSL